MERIINISTVYSRAGVCRAKVWDSWNQKTATAKDGGYGYSKDSAAVAEALNALGVKLDKVASYGWDIEHERFQTGGFGMWSIIDALRADGFRVYKEQRTDKVAVYICMKE